MMREVHERSRNIKKQRIVTGRADDVITRTNVVAHYLLILDLHRRLDRIEQVFE